VRRLRADVAEYAAAGDADGGAEDVDLRGLGGSITVYGLAVSGFLAALRASGRELPTGYAVRDLAVGAVAVHKFSRLLAKGSVTSPLRAPFTEFAGAAGSAEHHEEARGSHGVRHTVGELVTCPFCLGVWVGTAYVAGLGLAPRTARAWAAVFSVVAGSDALQQVYARLRID
jgi:hypothetical protein